MTRPPGRKPLIDAGDRLVALGRRMAGGANAAGELDAEAWWDYWHVLNQASNAYRDAGLGLLAGRLDYMARRVAALGERENVRAAWAKFDKLNARVGGAA
jgi:hypothetical protein